MTPAIFYGLKVFDLNPRNLGPRTLFHGVPNGTCRRSRDLELDQWITAEERQVDDNGEKYLSGFHVFPNSAALLVWSNSITHLESRWVCPVQAMSFRWKTQARIPIRLAKHLKIHQSAWDCRVRLSDFIQTRR